MQTATVFEFSDYSFNTTLRIATFNYTVYFKNGTQENFKEELALPEGMKFISEHTELIEKILQSIHLALGVSYYKLYCPPKITILGYEIDENQAHFWNTVYTQGLGQFYYVNTIDFRGLVQFPFSKNEDKASKKVQLNKNKVLLPFGGGKDSLLTLHVVRSIKNIQTRAFIFKNNDTLSYIAYEHNVPQLVVSRTFDSKLFILGKQGEKNKDHVPITLMISFVSVLLAVLYDFGVIIFSNEKSADSGNVEYNGININHQWSKSYECEVLLQKYIKTYLMDSVSYFSLLRGMYDIEIVRRFVKYGLHKKPFTSCNKNFTVIEKKETNLWCGDCPKCAFTFSLFSAFLPLSELITIFGSNYFDNENLLQTYRDLLGIGAMKPFECVGTPEETCTAFYMALKKGELTNTRAMKLFLKEALPKIKNIENMHDMVFKNTSIKTIPYPFKKLIT